MNIPVTDVTETKIITTSDKSEADYFNSEDLLTSDDKLFRQKTKNRFKNLSTICQSLFKHIHAIKKEYKDMSGDVVDAKLECEDNRKAITAIVEAFYALGFDEYFRSCELPSGYRKEDQLAPGNTTTDDDDAGYPKVWDNRELFAHRKSKPKTDEHLCCVCKFSQALPSSTGMAGFECRYSKSEFYKYLTPADKSRKCTYFSMGDSQIEGGFSDAIMIVNLTDKPEVRNYEI
jgi:hypothetical protein